MNTEDKKQPTKILRRALGVLVAFSPLLLLLASLIVGILWKPRPGSASIGFMIGAAIIAVINFHLSFIRPRLFYRWHGSMEGYRFISGLPLIGTVLAVLGVFFGFGAQDSALIGIVAFLLDTGGSGWFVVTTWKDGSLWDA